MFRKLAFVMWSASQIIEEIAFEKLDTYWGDQIHLVFDIITLNQGLQLILLDQFTIIHLACVASMFKLKEGEILAVTLEAICLVNVVFGIIDGIHVVNKSLYKLDFDCSSARLEVLTN